MASLIPPFVLHHNTRMPGTLMSISEKVTSQGKLYVSRDFYFFLQHTHKREKLVLSQRKLQLFIICT